MSEKVKESVVIALGYFDSVHLGHKRVIERARLKAEELGAKTVVFTFKGNLKAELYGENQKTVFTPEERERFIKDLGVDEIFFAPVDIDFLSMAKLAFLNMLNRKYNIACYVTGSDYRFGRFGKGSAADITRYAKEKGQDYIIVETLNFGEEKISTTAIKKLLSSGEIKKANQLLGRAYSITGTVFEDRKVGKKLGFPTMNIKIEKDKHRLKDGVYAGKVCIDGVEYSAIINYGARPTFDLSEKLIEAHAIDFSGDLYGKTVTIKFTAFMRDIKKFTDTEELSSQLQSDLDAVKKGIYD